MDDRLVQGAKPIAQARLHADTADGIAVTACRPDGEPRYAEAPAHPARRLHHALPAAVTVDTGGERAPAVSATSDLDGSDLGGSDKPPRYEAGEVVWVRS